MTDKKFTLTYDPEPSGGYRDSNLGYWYAINADGSCDATGITAEAALAALVVGMDRYIQELNDILSRK